MTTDVRATVARLLLWYPPAWRARYGEEFAELLADELAERPRPKAHSRCRPQRLAGQARGRRPDRPPARPRRGGAGQPGDAGQQRHAVRDVRRGDLVTASDCLAGNRSAAAFASADVVTHADALGDVAVRVASGADDPFRPGVEALARALPPGALVDISPGCHTGSFFAQQEPASLGFLGRHLTQA